MMFRFLFLLFFYVPFFTWAQVLLPDYIYDSNIRTVILRKPEFQFSLPLIALHSGEQLVIEFDDLHPQVRLFSYSLVLCDVHWQPVRLLPNEYISGQFEERISPGTFSTNTRIPYVHYEHLVPDPTMQIMRSGNYLLVVWYEDEKGQRVIAFTKRMFVYENKMSINGRVINQVMHQQRNHWQRIEFQINTNNVFIPNPYENIKVVILQNNDWNRALLLSQPVQIRGNILDYSREDLNIFAGGNEFRGVNLKSLRHPEPEIDGIQLLEDNYYVFIVPDVRRTFDRYVHRGDINGRYLVKTDDKVNSQTEAEYIYVIFSLRTDAPRTDGKVYLYGQLTNWQLNAESEMTYNYERKAYEKTILLKQGYYDYLYAFLRNKSTVPDITELEGNFGGTENEYSIWVYVRLPGDEYDQLMGVLFLTTRQ